MRESGRSWQKAFKAEPIEAAHVRLWTAGRVRHPDAPLIAHELYVAVMASGAPVVEMTLSTAGPRIRITAHGTDPIPLHNSYGPGWLVISGLCQLTGRSVDERGLWGQLEAGR